LKISDTGAGYFSLRYSSSKSEWTITPLGTLAPSKSLQRSLHFLSVLMQYHTSYKTTRDVPAKQAETRNRIHKTQKAREDDNALKP